MTMQEIALTTEVASVPVVEVEQAKTRKLGPLGWLAIVWLVGLAAMALLVPYISKFDNKPIYLGLIKLGPFKQGNHLLGVDQIGRDQLSLLLWGARSSL